MIYKEIKLRALEPEDLEQGVILKLKISVRRSSESAKEDQSDSWAARAA